MASISGLALLIVEDDQDSRELLELFLAGEGARVRGASTAAEARAAIREQAPDVVLMDMTLPDEDGFTLIASLRADASTRNIPAIALTGHSDAASRRRALGAGFQKFVTKPVDIFSLPVAIASVVARSIQPAEEMDDARAARLIAERDLRALLATLNAATPFRYTSILRFDGDALESVWTFDRANQAADTFPPDMQIAASYCVFVKATGASFSVSDAAHDPRVASHPKRHELRAYCGVPVMRDDGSIFGTLCHYDQTPHPVLEGTIAAMERVARMLGPALGAATKHSLC
jgi:CheY-like chemotaxis protein